LYNSRSTAVSPSGGYPTNKVKATCDGETAVDLELYNSAGNDPLCTSKEGDMKVKNGECFGPITLESIGGGAYYKMDISMSLDAAAEDVAQGLLGIIIGIVVAVICCILCCCALCWYMAKQNKAQNTVVVQQVPVAK
jgi:hypothetical protein